MERGAGWLTRLSYWFFWCWSGPSPLLAEGPGRRFPSFLWGVPRHSWLRVVGFFLGWCGGFLCCVCLWCGQCSRFRVFCVSVAPVLVVAIVVVVVVCVVCARRACVWCCGGGFDCLPWPLRTSVGGSVRVWGWCVVVPRQSWLGSVGGGAFPMSPCVLSPLFPLAVLPCMLLAWCLLRDYPGCGGCAVGLGGGGGVGLTLALVLSPGVSPFEGPMLALPGRVYLCCTGGPLVPSPYKWTCAVARYSGRSPHRGRVHCWSLGSPCGTGASLASPDGRCALPAAPCRTRTAVRAVESAPGQAHWSAPKAGATSGR